MQPLQKELQGISLTLGDLSDRSNGFDDQIFGELKQELGEMRNILHLLASRTENITEPVLPENLLLIYQQMKFSGLEEKFAKRLVIEAQKNIDESDIKNFAYVSLYLNEMPPEFLGAQRAPGFLWFPLYFLCILSKNP